MQYCHILKNVVSKIETHKEAAKAIELMGDKAILNFPKENYTKELQGEQKTEN